MDILKENHKKANDLIEITNRIKNNGYEYDIEEVKLSKWNRKWGFRGLVNYKTNINEQNASLNLCDKMEMYFWRVFLENRVYAFHNSLYKSKWSKF